MHLPRRLMTLILMLILMAESGSGIGAVDTAVVAEQEKPILIFQVISDVHLVTESAVKKLRNALHDLQVAAPKSDALIINGDLGNGREVDYAALRHIIRNDDHPKLVYYTIGNHEFYKAWYSDVNKWSMDSFPNGETDTASIGRFLKMIGEKKVYYDRWIKGYHFMMLGSEHYRQTDSSIGEDAYLSEEQLTWLDSKLAEDKSNSRPVFLFLHQPIPQTVSGTYAANYRGVVQHQTLKDILAKHPNVMLFTGHTHRELKLPDRVVHQPFAMINSSSVFEPWTSNDKPVPANLGSSEGLVVEVYKDHVQIRGRDFRNHKWIFSDL